MEVLRRGVLMGGIRRISTLRSVQFGLPRVHVQHEFHDIIKWNKPERLPLWDVQRSCDLKPLPPVDPNWLKLEYRPFAKLIDKLPPEDRHMFTVGIGTYGDGIAVIVEDTTGAVRRHKYDKRSPESKIAWMTVKIRNLQALLPVDYTVRKTPWRRTQLKELIDKRKKYLNQLRMKDYRKFEWLIEVLGILFQPFPEFLKERVERKKSITRLTDMYCDAIRQKRMDEYKQELDSQKIPFLEEKLATLRSIKADEDSMNIECSVEEEIQKTIKRLEVLNNSFMEVKPVPDQPQPSPSLES